MNKYQKIKDFHGERSKGIGSSDVPILAGLTKQWGSTQLTLWETKTGRRERWQGNNKTAWGHKLEGLVLKEFLSLRYLPETVEKFYRNYLSGKSYGPFKVMTECRHPERSYMLAHADLVVIEGHEEFLIKDLAEDLKPVSGAYIVEAKTTGMMSGKRRKGEVFTGYDKDDMSAQGIPDSVYLQVEHQEYVYDINAAYVAVLIDTSDYREYGPVIASKNTQEKILAISEKFWNCLESDTPPQPETWDDVVSMWPSQKNTTAMISGEAELEVMGMLEKAKKLKQSQKTTKKKLDEIKNALGILIGENQVLQNPDGEIFARTYEKSRESIFSIKEIEKQAPDLARQIIDLGFIKRSSWREIKF